MVSNQGWHASTDPESLQQHGATSESTGFMKGQHNQA